VNAAPDAAHFNFPGVSAMKIFHRLLCAAVLGAGLCAQAGATATALSADGTWQSFEVDASAAPLYDMGWIDAADGSAQSFTFTIAAGQMGTLTVVDGGFAGDTFAVYNNGLALGNTNSVAVYNFTDPDSTDTVGVDFDSALSDARYSRLVLTLGAGTYTITGGMVQSAQFDGADLDASVGGVSLTVASVPEPSSAALLLAGLLLVGFVARRRTR
jgi:hypothetical protein